MSLLRKPFLVVAAYFIILRGMNTGETISSIIGSASERMRADVWEADARLFAENTDYW